MIIYDNFAHAYKMILHELYNNPQYVTSPRGMKCHENQSYQFTIKDPRSALYINNERSSQIKYIAAELIWYFSGSCFASDITKYAKFWDSIKDEHFKVNSAYGNLLFTEKNEYDINEWSWALQSLLNDADTRQATVRFNKPHHSYENVKDFPCTMYGIFSIRHNKLNFTIHMRSNDVILGTPTDVAFFVVLQMQMLEHLKKHKQFENLNLGSYTHNADSLHIYERHLVKVKKMLDNQFVPVKFTLDTLEMIHEDGSPTVNTQILSHKYLRDTENTMKMENLSDLQKFIEVSIQ